MKKIADHLYELAEEDMIELAVMCLQKYAPRISADCDDRRDGGALAMYMLACSVAFSETSDEKAELFIKERLTKAAEIMLQIRAEAFPDIDTKHSWRKTNVH